MQPGRNLPERCHRGAGFSSFYLPQHAFADSRLLCHAVKAEFLFLPNLSQIFRDSAAHRIHVFPPWFEPTAIEGQWRKCVRYDAFLLLLYHLHLSLSIRFDRFYE